MNTPSDDFEIAPAFRVSDWKNLDIQNSTEFTRVWGTAIDVFERRINARFINQIEVMVNNGDSATAGFSGFAIVALDCLLIETLDQFYNGNHRTPSGKRHYKLLFWRKYADPHVAAFHAVFQRSSTLKTIFDTTEKTKVFYQHIRCGLLHQAQTKKNSKINRKIRAPVVWCDEKKPANGLIVHPLHFHECVKDVYSEYLKELRYPANHEMRRRFKRKMNGIAGMK